MNIILDLIGSALLLGMLILSVMGVNVNMATESTKSTTEFHIQTETIQLARIMEFDFSKIGYDIATGKIVTADTSRFKFKSNLLNVAGHVDSVEYILGSFVTTSNNPRDKVLIRYENTTGVLINYSITRFKLSYYNSRDQLIAAPVTGSNRDSIKAIRVYLTIESPEPLGTDSASQYAAGYYEKLLHPRNL